MNSPVVKSTLLESVPDIVHGFGTTAQLIPDVFQPHWEVRPQKKQIHGADICEVTHPSQSCGSADGFYSKAPAIPITVVHADCVPILFARQDGAMIAALHGGWRSTYEGIVAAFASRLTRQGENLSHWVAAVGPAIGACCYEVQEELTTQFEDRFPHISPSVIHPQFRRLDLAAIIEEELSRLGFGQIDRLPICTHCDRITESDFRFKSYRRGDRGPQQHSGLMIIA